MNKPHVTNNSGNNEWYTPMYLIEKVKAVLGTIDLDPASNEFAQKSIGASVYFTEETNGLDKDWFGNVWLNPPYSSALIKQFCGKLQFEFESGNTKSFMTITNNATETQWFAALAKASSVSLTFLPIAPENDSAALAAIKPMNNILAAEAKAPIAAMPLIANVFIAAAKA